MLRCDLHIHSNYSHDGESSVEEILHIAEERGLDAIAIADHDTVEGNRYAQTLDSPVLIIPAVEVSTKQGHLLVLGSSEPFDADEDIYQTIAEAHSRGAITILPHPFHLWRHGAGISDPTTVAAVDAVETYNSRHLVGRANSKAKRYAAKYHKPCVAGSDAHVATYVGYGVTLIDAEKNVDAILRAIREGKTTPTGQMTPLSTYTRQSMGGVKRRIARRIEKR